MSVLTEVALGIAMPAVALLLLPTFVWSVRVAAAGGRLTKIGRTWKAASAVVVDVQAAGERHARIAVEFERPGGERERAELVLPFRPLRLHSAVGPRTRRLAFAPPFFRIGEKFGVAYNSAEPQQVRRLLQTRFGVPVLLGLPAGMICLIWLTFSIWRGLARTLPLI